MHRNAKILCHHLRREICIYDVPCTNGRKFLDNGLRHLIYEFLIQLLVDDHVLGITYQGFGKPEPNTFEIEPYLLKVVKRRWYVVARSPYYSDRNRDRGIEPGDVYRVYALDRISDIRDTDKVFKMKKDFDAGRYFEGCCGVITSDEPVRRIVLLAYGGFADYLRTLPLHESQREIESDDESTLFEYHLKPTFDFYQLILAQGDQVEVLEPESVRGEMRNFARNMLSYYTRKVEDKTCRE